MSDKAKEEFSLDQFSEAETDEEFGLPEFKEHFADTLTPAVLRDWTAKDFASIYVRFRPHLERHARRFLVNPSQVEEVVQDAFLYLMTTLPELDSELGVLKFLKWKVRLLAIDVIRANSKVSLAPLDDHEDLSSHEGELSEGIERADDAAVVSLALAKLQPRQREALIATLYEEKENEAVARQMGLSDNAFRQLLFRARSSFRKALVGEAEVAGKTVSEILSIAARKAAASPMRNGAFLLLGILAISFGALLPSNPNSGSQVISLPTPAEQPEISPAAPAEDAVQDAPTSIDDTVANSAQESLAVQPAAVDVLSDQAPAEDLQVAASEQPAPSQTDSRELFLEQERVELSRFLEESATEQVLFGFTKESEGGSLSLSGDQKLHVAALEGGTSVYVGLDTSGEGVVDYLNVVRSTAQGAVDVALVPSTIFLQQIEEKQGLKVFEIWASGFVAADLTGQFSNVVLEDSTLTGLVLTGTLEVDLESGLINSSFRLETRSSYLASKA